MNELSLWEKYWQNRSIEGRDVLIGIYLPLITPIARLLTPRFSPYLTRDEIEEIGNATLAKAVEKYTPVREIKFQPYLFSAMRNESINAIRSMNKGGRGAFIRRDADVLHAVRDPQATCPLELLIVQERIQAFWGIVERLPEKEKKIIRLRYGDGLTAKEVGKIVGLSRPNISHICIRVMREASRELSEF